MRKQEQYQNRAKRTYNVLNTGVGRAIGEATGVPKGLLKETKASFAESSKAIAEKAAKQASGLALSDTEKDKVRQAALDEKTQTKERDRETLRVQKESQKQQLEIVRQAADQQASVFEQQKQTLQKQLEAETKTQDDLKTKHDSMLKSISEEIGNTAEGSAARTDVEARYQNAKLARDSEMAAQDEKIKTVSQTISAPVAELQKKIEQTRAPIAPWKKRFNKEKV